MPGSSHHGREEPPEVAVLVKHGGGLTRRYTRETGAVSYSESMTSIPWGWQLLVSFAVPIISALGAYWVATMTARRADRRRDKDQEAEEARRQEDRTAEEARRREDLKAADKRRTEDRAAEEARRQQDRNDRERERLDQLRRESNSRQRRAVAELSSTFKQAWYQATDEQIAVTLEECGEVNTMIRRSSAVAQFYREVTHAVVLLELELDNQEVLDQLLVLRKIVNDQYGGLAELKKTQPGGDPVQHLTRMAEYPTMTQEIVDQQMVLEIVASRVLRD
jgi:hypothetical protein